MATAAKSASVERVLVIAGDVMPCVERLSAVDVLAPAKSWAQLYEPTQVADTKISVDGGFYEAPLMVELRSATKGAMIKYTLDGKEPTKGSLFNAGEGESTLIRSALIRLPCGA